MKNAFILPLVIGLVLALLPPSLFGQGAEEAIGALRRLEASSRLDLSFPEYGQVVDEAISEVEQFLLGDEARDRELLARKVELAMQHFLIAAELWRMKFVSESSTGLLQIETDSSDRSLWEDFVQRYPEADSAKKAGGALAVNGRKRVADINAMIPIVWKHASKSLREADESLKTTAQK